MNKLGNLVAQLEAQKYDYALNPDVYAEPTADLAIELAEDMMVEE